MTTKKNIYSSFRILTSTLLISFLMIGAYSPAVNAEESNQKNQYQSAQSLAKLVNDYVKQKVDQKIRKPQITINPISSKLRLGLCQSQIKLIDKAPTKTTGRMSFKLSCHSPEWKLYVTANVDGELPVIITVRGILQQTTIKPSDLQRIYVPYKQVKKGALVDLKNVIGMRATHAIAPNTIMTINLLQPPYLVFKDQPIKIITNAGNIKVETTGTALEDGVNQQQIPIRNNSSKKVLKGIVIAPNTVWVP